MRRIFFALLVTTSCSQKPTENPPAMANAPAASAEAPATIDDAGSAEANPSPPRSDATFERPPLERVPCDENGITVVPPTLAADLACHPNCPLEGVPVPFRIVNCTDRKVKLDSVGHPGGLSPGVHGDWNRVLEPGTRSSELTQMVRVPDDAELRMEFVTVDEVDDKPTRVGVKLAIIDSKRDKALADCKARGDHWGALGLAGTETCWKLMRDVGKTCHDRRDCQGECVFVSEKDVSAAEKRVTGKCSKFQAEFGCARRIGETKKGRVPKYQSIPRVCAD